MRRADAIAAAAAAAFVLLLVLVVTGWAPLHRLDTSVVGDLNGYYADHRGQTRFWRAVSTVGQPATFEVLAVLGSLVLYRRGRRLVGGFALAGVIGANLLSTLVKLAVDRARPHVGTVLTSPQGASFPSGHAITSFAAAAVFVVLVRHRLAWLAFLVPALITYSRLALGAHYPSDVAGSWLLGLAWVAALRNRLVPVRI